jgi:hypothetical protein
MIPDVELFASRFRPACVEFEPGKDDLRASSDDPVSDLGGVPFDLNINLSSTGETRIIYQDWRRSATEKDFWSAYLVGAFQPQQGEDFDNDDEDWWVGRASQVDAISVIFRETVRDIKTEVPNEFVIGEEDVWRVAGLHEVAHQFNLGHDLVDDGPIMDEDSYQTEQVHGLIFSPDGLRKITERDYPREYNGAL